MSALGKSNEISLVGQWKVYVFSNTHSYYCCHDVNCFKHSSQGVIEAELVGTQIPGQNYTLYPKRSKYIGVIKGDSVTLTYKDVGGPYTSSTIMKRETYQMSGTYTDSSKNSGYVQWVKATRLK